MEVPNRELAKKEQLDAISKMPFHLKEWDEVERFLQWQIYLLSNSMLAESSDELRSIKLGRAKMCEDILKLKQSRKMSQD